MYSFGRRCQLARKKGTDGSKLRTPPTPLKVLSDEACFTALTEAFSGAAVKGKISGKRAFALVREVIGPLVGEIDLNWIRAFMRLVVKKRILRRTKGNGNGQKMAMLSIGDLKFRPRRTARVYRRKGSGTSTSTDSSQPDEAPVRGRARRSVPTPALANGNDFAAQLSLAVETIGRQIKALEADQKRLRAALALLRS